MSDPTDVILPPLSQGEQVRFYRVGLEDLPELEVPDGFEFRHYLPGDELEWAETLGAAFPEHPWSMEKVQKEFTHNDRFRPERICIAEQGGKIAGVAAAWESGPREWGYVHWVAVRPEHQGKRLGRLVTLGTLHRFRKEGKQKAYLDTDEPRLPAVATYLSLGFQPDLRRPEDQATWERIQEAMSRRSR